MKTTDLYDAHLRINSVVWWRGAWGGDIPKLAQVKFITLTNGYEKEGVDVNCVPWELCDDRRVIVDLNNGHWAYGFQVRPYKDEATDDQAYENLAHAAWAAREE